MKPTPQYPAPKKIQTSFGIIEIASIEEVTVFVGKYQITGSNPFTVTGGDRPYKIDLLGQTCPCDDVRFRHRTCKHLRNLNFLLVHDML